MKIWVFCHLRNEEAMLPFFLRHYEAFADEIHVFDDESTDATREILCSHQKVTIHSMPFRGLMEGELLKLARRNYRLARGKADYAMWVDVDEFIYHPYIVNFLTECQAAKYDVVRTMGFNMMTPDGLPADDGKSQLWELINTGVHAPVYSKPVVFNPEVELEWTAGKHHVEKCNGTVSPELYDYEPAGNRLKLLHFRYLGVEYTVKRNARQWERSVEKGTAWGVSTAWKGEGSPEWVARALPFRYNVLDPQASYLNSPINP